MDQINERIGKTIQTYRKAQGMTLEKLAAAICKSKSTVSKYELGDISLDVTVLSDISRALGLKPQQILSGITDPEEECEATVSSGFRRYLYSYDGYSHHIIRALLIIASPEDNESPVSLFYDADSFETPERCRVLYVGTQNRHETITNYMLKKRGGIESPQICAIRPLDYQGLESGILFGISSRKQQPAALKCILSDTLLEENKELIKKLIISSEDIRMIKKVNQFMLEPPF